MSLFCLSIDHPSKVEEFQQNSSACPGAGRRPGAYWWPWWGNDPVNPDRDLLCSPLVQTTLRRPRQKIRNTTDGRCLASNTHTRAHTHTDFCWSFNSHAKCKSETKYRLCLCVCVCVCVYLCVCVCLGSICLFVFAQHNLISRTPLIFSFLLSFYAKEFICMGTYKNTAKTHWN